MTAQTWRLTDTACDLHHGEFRVTAEDVPGAGHGWSVTKRTLRGGLSDGVDVVEIDNGKMQIAILPTRGMGVWQARIGDDVLGWRSPVRGPVHPKFVPVFDPGGFGWLEGFDELTVRCGLESNGGPDFNEQGRLLYPLHGRIANRPAYLLEVIVDDVARTITVRGVVEETRFHFQKLRLVAAITTAFDSTTYSLHDNVENFGGAPAGMQMLYHVNFGEPLLSPGAELIAPLGEVAPHDGAATANVDTWNVYGPPLSGAPEQCFFFDLAADGNGQTQVLLKNAGATAGAALRFNKRDLPRFTVWKNMVAPEDGYVTGLEPATNYPNPRSFETQHGRVIQLAPGATWSADVAVDWLTTAEAVASAEAAVLAIQDDAQPVVHATRRADWSA